ncbi:MAG: hypothetical protein KAI76_03445 [Alphaproteobacteria bacterium]|nr:hypothetical protein [Alphaproteobacteria bacterium]
MEKKPQEENQKYFFVKTFQTSDGWKAMIADDEVLRENRSSAESIKSAVVSKVFNVVRLRGGVHFYDSSQVNCLLEKCEKMGMDKSAESLQNAIEILKKKNEAPQNQVTSVVAPGQAM